MSTHVPPPAVSHAHAGVPDLTEAQARRVRREEGAIDVSSLADFAFGHRGTMWWATMGFIVIEGTTLAILAFSYFYLRRNFDAWPPPRTPMANLEIGTASLVILLLSLVPNWKVLKASRAENLASLRPWKIVTSVFALLIIGFRALELANLNTRWDEHAYGSLVWAIVFLHGTLIAVDVFEGWFETLLVFRGPIMRRHFADFEDGSIYWAFSVLVWVPFYVLVYLYPRWS